MDVIFSVAGTLAMAGWGLLALSPLSGKWREMLWRVTGLVIPVLIGCVYLYLIVTAFPGAPGGYGSLAKVRMLFETEALLLAGWLHYLAFDLFVGTWIARDGASNCVPHLLLLPCFALTFLFGPVGLIAYLSLRFLLRRRMGTSPARMA